MIADNASTDGTTAIARALARELPQVEALRLEPRAAAARCAPPGRLAGATCRYMDVDLSTDLRALLPLVAPLLSGHSDVAIGTRLAHGSRSCAAPSAS